jgi:glutaredoxin
MKKIIVLAIAIGALYHFKPGLFPSFLSGGAFDKNGNPEVLVFTVTNCGGWCEKGVQEIRNHGVQFQELALDGNEENQKRYESLGGGSLPFVVVGNQSIQGYDKGMIVSALAQAYGDKSLTPLERRYYNNHFQEDGRPIVYMYGASWCQFCKKLREDLVSRNVNYVEVDVERAPDRAVMEDTMAIPGYPLVYVGYQRVVGGSQISNVLTALKNAGNRKL